MGSKFEISGITEHSSVGLFRFIREEINISIYLYKGEARGV